jgi:hypothetical protein
MIETGQSLNVRGAGATAGEPEFTGSWIEFGNLAPRPPVDEISKVETGEDEPEPAKRKSHEDPPKKRKPSKHIEEGLKGKDEPVHKKKRSKAARASSESESEEKPVPKSMTSPQRAALRLKTLQSAQAVPVRRLSPTGPVRKATNPETESSSSSPLSSLGGGSSSHSTSSSSESDS